MIKKFILIILFQIILYTQNSYAEIIKSFIINGNDRISDETIILFSGTKVNENIDTNNLNDIIKKLYETNFFKDISLSFEKNVLTINVVESPLIQTVSIEGIKKQSFVDQIKALLLQKEKSSFNQNKIKSDQNIILNTLRMNGYYFSEIKTNIKKNDNNTVDIIYDINLGKKALIKNIKFVGNKVFKDSKLRKVIVSEEAKFWKFISSKKNVDVKRFKLDENLLKNFYKNNGYYKVKINSSFAQIIDDKYFEIVFNIDAGQRYFFNELNLNLPVDYNSKDFENLNKLLTELKLKPYSLNRIENILDEIDDIALGKNYEFVSASYEEKIVNNNQINLDINLKDTEKFFVERINIYGNNITSEKVIRNKLLLDEGDPFNELLANKSFNEIKALRLFKNVNTDIETSRENMTKIININVEEKPTGEIFAAAGTGTQGSSISLGITENNYLGEGKQLGTNLSLSDDSLQGRLFINEPNYKNSNKSFNRSFERSEEDYLTNYGYKTEKTGFGFGTYYEQYRDIFFAPSINTSYESITTNSVASASKKKQQGDYLDLNLNYDIALNKLNQNFNPTDGYKFIFSQELPIYSEDYTLINRLNYTKYFETNNSLVFSLGFFTASSNSISNDDARITKRIFIPSRKLRGFEAGKIGPKDGTDFIGGNYGSAFNVATTLPNLFADVQNLDFSFFYDAANVWGVDYDSSIDENSKIRSSTGLAVEWFTPVGPLSLSYAIPLTKSSTDKTETVRFNIGTTF
tara:strand:+ start:4654 stop:6897 length:2244 start_codon:yes stop_codon:yes gene_type:complete